MSVSQSDTSNLILKALSADDFALLQPHLQRFELTTRQTLIEADTPIEHVHFLESGVASIVSDFPDGAVEIGIFGHEGMSGTAVLLEPARHRTGLSCRLQDDRRCGSL